MTHRTYIKCEVCGSITLVRTQISWLQKHPIRINCAKCGILISGLFTQNPEIPQFNISFENATEVNMQKPDYYIEVSGELLTSKIRQYEKDKDEYQLPPFINAMQSMYNKNDSDKNGGDKFSEFKHNFLTFLNFIENEWPFIRRIHEIWLSGNHDFLAEQMRNKLPVDIFPLNNELEYLRGIHHLFLIGFRSVLPKNFYDVITKSIWNGISGANANSDGFVSLTEFFNDNGLFVEYERRALKILNGFIDNYPFFITTIGLESYKSPPDLINNGTTTVSFEDIKHFYLDCFEANGELISLVIAYNNLNYRGDPFVMPDSSFETIKTLQNFIEMRNKGNKITFCAKDELFNNLICIEATNGLRNAIGHDSYYYDGITQSISYYSSGKMEKGEKETIYLIEFIQKTLDQFYTMIVLIELLYQTRKSYYVQHGIMPINPNVFKTMVNQKIGRNELCLCGSGKKYKKCCGVRK